MIAYAREVEVKYQRYETSCYRPSVSRE